MPERPQQLEHLEYLGDATKFAAQMQALIPKCLLLENFSLGEVRKRDRDNAPQLVAVVDAGKTLGEMSMIDGEARFATCVVAEAAVLAVLDRENLARIIVEQPMLGAKILMELVLILSQRLRTTSERLIGMMDERAPKPANVV